MIAYGGIEVRAERSPGRGRGRGRRGRSRGSRDVDQSGSPHVRPAVIATPHQEVVLLDDLRSVGIDGLDIGHMAVTPRRGQLGPGPLCDGADGWGAIDDEADARCVRGPVRGVAEVAGA